MILRFLSFGELMEKHVLYYGKERESEAPQFERVVQGKARFHLSKVVGRTFQEKAEQ